MSGRPTSSCQGCKCHRTRGRLRSTGASEPAYPRRVVCPTFGGAEARPRRAHGTTFTPLARLGSRVGRTRGSGEVRSTRSGVTGRRVRIPVPREGVGEGLHHRCLARWIGLQIAHRGRDALVTQEPLDGSVDPVPGSPRGAEERPFHQGSPRATQHVRRQLHVDILRRQTPLKDDHPAVRPPLAVRDQAAATSMEEELVGHGGQRGTAEESLDLPVPPPEVIPEGRGKRGVHSHPHSLRLAAALSTDQKTIAPEIDVTDLHPKPLDAAKSLAETEKDHESKEAIASGDLHQPPDRPLGQPPDPQRRTAARESHLVEHRVPRKPSEVGEDGELPDVVMEATAEPPAVLNAPLPWIRSPPSTTQEGGGSPDDPSVPSNGIRKASPLPLGRVPAPDDVVTPDHGPCRAATAKSVRRSTDGERWGGGRLCRGQSSPSSPVLGAPDMEGSLGPNGPVDVVSPAGGASVGALNRNLLGHPGFDSRA